MDQALTKALTKALIPSDAPPNSLRNAKVGLRTKQQKKKIIGAFTLQDLANGVVGAQFGVCLLFQPRL
jgi:hypothetical protein